MRRLLQSLIMSLAVIAIASPTFAGNDRDDKMWDRDKKEQSHHSKKNKHDKKERHRKGGLPRCESELAGCLINLTETETQLQVCEDDLAQCQATEGQAFPATGQTSCWDSTGALIDCDGTGHDGDIQAGAELSYTDTGLTIIDNNTKLEWMKQDDNNGDCGSYPGNLDRHCSFTWDDAFMFVATLNANNHAGYSDWRVPNVKELQSIVNNGNINPSVSAEFNAGCVAGCTVDDPGNACSCTGALYYWTSTTAAHKSNNAWIINFGSGQHYRDPKQFDRRVRAVRSGLSLSLIATTPPSFAEDDHENKKWDRDKKENHHRKKEEHGKKERHRKGGLPRCESELAECLINLTETETQLQVCEDDLAQCQATEGQAFPATGQTSCWDSTGALIDCDGTGHDGDIQAGAELSYTDTGLTIIDNNTKLEWMKQDDNNGDCGSYPGNLDRHCSFTWDDAFMFVATLNANNHAGYSDWRVPNVKELQSIRNDENINPSVSAEFNAGCVAGCTVDDPGNACSCTGATYYWSSTSDDSNIYKAWSVFFNDAIVDGKPKNFDSLVRAVRGGL